MVTTDVSIKDSVSLFCKSFSHVYHLEDHTDNHDGVITDLEPDILDVKSSGP